jgi:WD40 repeat protein
MLKRNHVPCRAREGGEGFRPWEALASGGHPNRGENKDQRRLSSNPLIYLPPPLPFMSGGNAAPGATLLQTLRGPPGPVTAVCSLGGDPPRVASASGGEGGEVRVWDLGTGRCLRVLRGHKAGVLALALCPVASSPHPHPRLVSASEDATLRVWHTDDGCCEAVLTGHALPVVACAAIGRGEVVSGGRLGSVRVWRTVDTATDGGDKGGWAGEGVFDLAKRSHRLLGMQPLSRRRLALLVGEVRHSSVLWRMMRRRDGGIERRSRPNLLFICVRDFRP